MKKTLIIQSLPFQRLLRSHFDKGIINSYIEKSDVVVVSPFANNSEFLARYRSLNVLHVSPPTLHDFSKLRKGFFVLSTWLRTYGFWFRWRKHIPYFWENRHMLYGANGNDLRFNLISRLIINSLGFLGHSCKSWKFVDKLHGCFTYKFTALINITSKYEKVILIQSASWGLQDTILAFWARKKNWKTVFIPYSTDQVGSNGWLFCDYDKNCVQGEAENMWIKQLHNIPEHKIFKLGSSYLRVIRNLSNTINFRKCSRTKNKITIVYCGVSPIYFPSHEESEVVFKLANNLVQFTDFEIFVIYRPAVNNLNEIHDFDKLSTLKNITFQIPPPTSIGVDSYIDDDVDCSLFNLITTLSRADLLIMSSFTSIALEAAVIGLPVVSYLPISNEIIEKRKLELLFKKSDTYNTLINIPTAFDFNQLIKLIKKSIDQRDFFKESLKKIILDWDYVNVDFKKKLFDEVFS